LGLIVGAFFFFLSRVRQHGSLLFPLAPRWTRNFFPFFLFERVTIAACCRETNTQTKTKPKKNPKKTTLTAWAVWFVHSPSFSPVRNGCSFFPLSTASPKPIPPFFFLDAVSQLRPSRPRNFLFFFRMGNPAYFLFFFCTFATATRQSRFLCVWFFLVWASPFPFFSSLITPFFLRLSVAIYGGFSPPAFSHPLSSVR